MDEIATTPCQRLKKETQALHYELDKRSTMRRLLATELTLYEYAVLLRRMWSAYRIIELTLDEFVSANPSAAHWADPAIYRRTQDIHQDLTTLEMTLDERAMSSVERSRTLSVRNEAEVIGCMYVLGGSIAGARVIERFLTEHFGDKVAAAMHFFGTEARVNIPDFVTLQGKINAALKKPKDLEKAVVKACDVFSMFIKEFTR